MADEFYSPEEDNQTQDESVTDEPRENKIEETKDSGDGNNTEEQKKLGIDIQMIGAREVELGKTRSQTQEMMSPRNESMERAVTEFRQPLQVQSHLEVPRILVQLGHIQRT